MTIEDIKTTEYPTIRKDNTCIVNDNIIVSDCEIDEKNNIIGFVYGLDIKPIKAKYIYDNMTWYFGKSICKTYLVPLNERTEEEKKRISELGIAKQVQRREERKNFNELAKAMLEQTLNEKQISEILGTSTNMLLDNSVASVMLARMIQGAMDGSFKCAEFVRDTAGYRPKDVHEVQADVMTDADRRLIENVSKRIG